MINYNLPPVKIGKTFIVPEIYRGILALRNISTVILSINDSGLFKIGSNDGVLDYIILLIIEANLGLLKMKDVSIIILRCLYSILLDCYYQCSDSKDVIAKCIGKD